MGKSLCFLLLFFSTSFFCFGLKIKGQASGFEGEFVRLYCISDYISMSESKLDVVKIDQTGHFELNGHLNQPSLIKIRISSISVDLLTLPDHFLEIRLNYDKVANEGRLYDRHFEVEVIGNSDKGINAGIFRFQKNYASFIEENRTKFIAKQALPAVSEFAADCRKEISGAPAFLKSYVEYELASLEDAALGSERKLFTSYLEHRPVQFGNIAYMKFFTQFYSDRFLELSLGKNGFQFMGALNERSDYGKLMEIIKGHEFLRNDTIAQIFLILGLKEVYKDKTFKKEKIIAMLGLVRNAALNSDIERIAQSVERELIFMQKGSKAPDFNLSDRKGDIHHLSEVSGRPVLLIFWSANSRTSLRDFTWLKDYHTKYGDVLKIICVNLDENREAALKFMDENALPFVMLFADRQYDLFDKYRIYSAPNNVLIDSKGNIYKYMAGKPEDGLENHIRGLTSQKR